VSASARGRFSSAAYRSRNFGCSRLMRNSVDFSVDVPGLVLATALTQMKINTLNVVSRYFTKFHSVGIKKEKGRKNNSHLKWHFLNNLSN